MATEPAQSTHPYQTSSQPLIGKGWIQGVALVMIFGFLVMGILAYRTYTASMPMPDKVVSESGESRFRGEGLTDGTAGYIGVADCRIFTGSGGYRVEFRRDGAARISTCIPMAHRPIHLSTRP